MEWYFGYWLWRVWHHGYVILHPPAKSHSNRRNDGRGITSYHIQDGGLKVGNLLPGSGLVTALFKKVEVYLHAEFWWDISIHGEGKTTSVFGKRMVSISTSVLSSAAILHLPAKFRGNRTIVGGVMASYPFFSRWRPAAILNLIWVILDHPRSVLSVSAAPQICTWSDLQFWRYCDFYTLPFWPEIIHSRQFVGVLGAYFPK